MLATHYDIRANFKRPIAWEIGINDPGMLSIPIIDNETGVQFDIEGLSSGEKGVILTFLLIESYVGAPQTWTGANSPKFAHPNQSNRPVSA
jgi:hypothetical protein